MKYPLLILKTSFVLFFFHSCSFPKKKCSSFNFNIINQDTSKIEKNIIYTNEKDTINFKLIEFNYSKTTVIDAFSNPECEPFYYLMYEDLKKRLEFCISYNINKEEKINYSILINSSLARTNFNNIKR
jgi:hypothetical protein